VAVHNMADSFKSSSYIRKECNLKRIRMLLRPARALYNSVLMILAQRQSLTFLFLTVHCELTIH